VPFRSRAERSRHRLLSALAAALVLVTATGCTDEPRRPIAAAAVEDDDVREAIDRGADYLADNLEEIEWGNLAAADLLHRRWDLSPLEDARTRALDLASAGEAGAEWPALGRMFDPDHPRSDTAADASDPVTFLAAALHCDQVPFGPDAAEQLRALIGAGGYGATHAGIAIGWLRDRSCDVPDLEALRAEAAEQISSELRAYQDQARTLSQSSEVDLDATPGAAWATDLALEQSAVLAIYLDAADLVDPSWVRTVTAAQRPDGGWADIDRDAERSHWHPTLVAVMTLAALTAPHTGAPLVVE
jgi:hypothetical protein